MRYLVSASTLLIIPFSFLAENFPKKIIVISIVMCLCLAEWSCEHEDSPETYSLLPFNTNVFDIIDAGSSQYNGTYRTNGIKVNNRDMYIHDDNSNYTIEYDDTNKWCIKDSGILQYCNGCGTYTLSCPVSSFWDIRNGISPGPTFQEQSIILPVPCDLCL